MVFAKTAMTTTAITTLVWLAVTLLTPAEPRTNPRSLLPPRPSRRPWLEAHRRPNRTPHAVPPTRDLGSNLTAWLLGCAMVYLCLFGTGKLLLHQPALGLTLLTLSALSAVALYRSFVAGFNEEPDLAAKTAIPFEVSS